MIPCRDGSTLAWMIGPVSCVQVGMTVTPQPTSFGSEGRERERGREGGREGGRELRRKEGRNEGGREGGEKEGRGEGRREGGKEGKQGGMKEKKGTREFPHNNTIGNKHCINNYMYMYKVS